VQMVRIIGFAMAFAACSMTAAQALSAAAAGDEDTPTSFTKPAGEPGAPRQRPAAQSAPNGNPLWSVPLRMLTATRDRPLFSPTRRAPPAPVPVVAVSPAPPPPPPQPAAPDRPQLTLVGTISGGSEGIGVFVDELTTRTIRIRTSQDYAGWTLLAVTRREATFKKDDRQATLTFPVPGQGQPTPVSQPTQQIQPTQAAHTAHSTQPGGRALPAWLHSEVQLNPLASAQSSPPAPPGSELAPPPSPSGASPTAGRTRRRSR
jgi:hypothetical protein